MSTSMVAGVHAGPGAVAALVRGPQVLDGDQKGATARRTLAAPLDREVALTAFCDHQLTVEMAVPSTCAIARLARRDKVGRVIVVGVAVQVVSDECSATRSVTGQPIHLDAAPVTRMRSGADLVVEHYSVLGKTILYSLRQRMPAALDVLVSRHLGKVQEVV